MSALADQIAEVLRAHERWRSWGLTDEGLWCPGCQRRYSAEVFTAHVAERVAELFTEEWGIVTDMGVTKDALTEQQAHRLVDKFDDMTARSRFVSPWTAEEAKP